MQSTQLGCTDTTLVVSTLGCKCPLLWQGWLVIARLHLTAANAPWPSWASGHWRCGSNDSTPIIADTGACCLLLLLLLLLLLRLSCRCRRPQPTVLVRASSGGDKSPATAAASPSSSTADDEEARIEAIEAASRKAGSKTAARRQIPIKNVTPRQQESAIGANRAEWKPGQLFPEGWEQMDLGEKVTELYLGKRGMLFWATEIAWKGAIALGVAWALFRIGGAVGLYQLQGDLTMPPM